MYLQLKIDFILIGGQKGGIFALCLCMLIKKKPVNVLFTGFEW